MDNCKTIGVIVLVVVSPSPVGVKVASRDGVQLPFFIKGETKKLCFVDHVKCRTTFLIEYVFLLSAYATFFFLNLYCGPDLLSLVVALCSSWLCTLCQVTALSLLKFKTLSQTSHTEHIFRNTYATILRIVLHLKSYICAVPGSLIWPRLITISHNRHNRCSQSKV